VPFQLRTGKALAQSRHTVTLGFKEPSRRMFDLVEPASGARANELTFEFSEPGVIWLDFLAKKPGLTMDLGAASLAFRYDESFTVARELEPYERLVHDAMLGDHTLFASADGIERLWEVATPLLERPPRPLPYPRGSWGPEEIDTLVAPHRWHLPYAVRDGPNLRA
jgi:glucose-6-phosphate 1-dehydrogenase